MTIYAIRASVRDRESEYALNSLYTTVTEFAAITIEYPTVDESARY